MVYIHIFVNLSLEGHIPQPIVYILFIDWQPSDVLYLYKRYIIYCYTYNKSARSPNTNKAAKYTKTTINIL